MKILYAFPATGNGHINRAIELYPYLSQLGQVDILISGTNSQLHFPYPVRYQSKGISLHYTQNGSVHYPQLLQQLHLTKLYKEICELPVHHYDWVISDFEPLSAWACKKRKIPCMQWGHQASFHFPETPRPRKHDRTGEFILKRYTPSDLYVGLHFKPYHANILSPVLNQRFFNEQLKSKDHITVYLSQYSLQHIYSALAGIPNMDIHIFHPKVSNYFELGPFKNYPVHKEAFTQSMMSSRLVLTGAGFETPAEAMLQGKRLICIPIRNHYEQQCNAEALRRLGVPVFDHLTPAVARSLEALLDTPVLYPFTKNYQEASAICNDVYEIWENNKPKNPFADIDFNAYDNLFC